MPCFAEVKVTNTGTPFDLPGALERCPDLPPSVRDDILSEYHASREPGWNSNPFAYPVTDTTWFQVFRVYMHLRDHLDDKEPLFFAKHTGTVEVLWDSAETWTNFRVETRDGLVAWWSRVRGEDVASGQGGSLADLLAAAVAWQERVRATP